MRKDKIYCTRILGVLSVVALCDDEYLQKKKKKRRYTRLHSVSAES